MSVGGIIKKVGAANKTCESPSDHIFDFTRSGYKIIPNMWSELAEVKNARTSDHPYRNLSYVLKRNTFVSNTRISFIEDLSVSLWR